MTATDTAATIWLAGEVPSLKNSKRIRTAGKMCPTCRRRSKTFIVKSAAYEKWEQAAIPQLLDHPLVGHPWTYPVYVGFHFHRGTRRRFDLHNALQGPLDVLVAAGILADDDMRHVIPVPMGCGWSLAGEGGPGVILRIIDDTNNQEATRKASDFILAAESRCVDTLA